MKSGFKAARGQTTGMGCYSLASIVLYLHSGYFMHIHGETRFHFLLQPFFPPFRIYLSLVKK